MVKPALECLAQQRDGTLHFAELSGDASQEIYVMTSDGSQLTRLTDHPALDGTPAWSPDGSRIAFSTTRYSTDESCDVVVMDASGANLVRLTTAPETDVRPIWSPDGSRILYSHRVAQGNYGVWVMNADGSNKRALVSGAGNEQAEDWREIR